MNIIKLPSPIALIFIGLLSPTVSAINVNFKGVLVIPDCTVNNNTPLDVDFGRLEIQTITAANTAFHAKNFDISLKCPYTVGLPKLTLTSSAIHDASQGVIQTSMYAQGLVIYLRQKDGTTPVPLGTATNVSTSVTGTGNSRTLTLNAGIGRIREMSELKAGEFTGTVGLQIRYE
ncbi:fimbrial protein [Salmonella enterica subsp. enterica serovar Hull]|uniref:Fimbrial protein n=1 Tax=Salmonella enterica subsp. enterica serovar Hull TaxID=1403564 RepID=A0A5X4PM72_SALET|nr:fimbrial protein [Salmonella enterica subsp. enterica serovar Putten]EBZ7588767.1 fimbrial protein [Salmonella enterica subsp. enterica serovar Hull]EBZ8651193.1 fimbrial protein [Salmonella enterica subsp. enterica serovar Hull]EEB7450865.1 fimbrial protein [Salmonella enterica subsp. enterica serovar Emek]